MNPAKACVLTAFAFLFLEGCTTTRTLSVSRANKTAPVLESGRPLLQSPGKYAAAVWLLTPTYKTRLGDLLPPAFLVVVRNDGDRALTLSREDISATAGGQPIHLLTYNEYCDEIDHQARLAGVKVRDRANRAEGEMYRDSKGRIRYLNPVAAPTSYAEWVHIEQQAWAGGKLIARQHDALLADARQMLDLCSIAPGQTGGGIVRLDPVALSPGQHLSLLVNAGGATHTFLFDVGP
jgi:hypothetical protein